MAKGSEQNNKAFANKIVEKKTATMTLKKTAVLFGASGLVGRAVLDELIQNSFYERIVCIGRRRPDIDHHKLQIHTSDLSVPDSFATLLADTDVMICLGTTMRKAGSKTRFQAIDLNLVVGIAKAAKEQAANSLIVISSLGANANSRNFYLQTKGRMEEQIRALQIKKNTFIRPSLILGQRKEFRLGESITKFASPLINLVLVGKLKKYRAIHADTIARAMVHIALLTAPEAIYESDQLHLLAGRAN